MGLTWDTTMIRSAACRCYHRAIHHSPCKAVIHLGLTSLACCDGIGKSCYCATAAAVVDIVCQVDLTAIGRVVVTVVKPAAAERGKQIITKVSASQGKEPSMQHQAPSVVGSAP
jgi:hypothetical protein